VLVYKFSKRINHFLAPLSRQDMAAEEYAQTEQNQERPVPCSQNPVLPIAAK